MNQEDSFWWQAVRYGEHDLAKLIPSQMLEERYTWTVSHIHVHCTVTYTCIVHVRVYMENYVLSNKYTQERRQIECKGQQSMYARKGENLGMREDRETLHMCTVEYPIRIQFKDLLYSVS